MDETQRQLDELRRKIDELEINPKKYIDHQHTGLDMTPVEYKHLRYKRFFVNHTIVGTAAATAANYGVFFIAPVACNVIEFSEVHQTLGTDGGTVTLQLEKLSGTTALDSGDVILGTALSLKATINSVQNATITTTNAYRTLAKGDRLALKDAGTLTAVANVTVKVELQVI